jgi:3-hydroxybutyryl-CoA dehydratase
MEGAVEETLRPPQGGAVVTKEDGGRHLSGPEAWLRPFDELRAGDTFASRARTITEADVVQFAALTGDWHPAHSDVTWAEENIFGQRVAHGMLVVCFAIGLVPNDYVMALRRIKNMVFKNPVFFGDTIHVEGKVARKMDMTDEVGMITGRWKIVNQRDETICKLEIEALWRRNPL